MIPGMGRPANSVNRYSVKAHHVDEFLSILDRHCATLRELDLITDREVEVFVGTERDTGEPVVIEIFEWADEDATQRAHTDPAISEVWESMGPLCEARAHRSPFEFLNLERIEP
jgi:quinol monooxygenase YgiN